MRKDLHFSFLLVCFLKYVVNINSVQNGCEFLQREMKLDVFRCSSCYCHCVCYYLLLTNQILFTIFVVCL